MENKKTKVKKAPFVCQHIALFVRDMEKVSAFYTHKLGFEFIKEYVAPKDMMKQIFGISSPCHIRYLELSGLGMELFFFHDKKIKKRSPATAGYDHWNIMVEDKTQFCEKLRKKRIKVIKVPKPHGFTYFIKDPEDNLIEVKSF